MRCIDCRLIYKANGNYTRLCPRCGGFGYHNTRNKKKVVETPKALCEHTSWEKLGGLKVCSNRDCNAIIQSTGV